MRLLAGLAAGALVLSACGGAATAPSPSPTARPSPTPSPSPTPQTKFVFSSDMKSSNEVPPITGPEASCAGKGTFTIDTTVDATGKITAAKALFETDVTGCPAGTPINIGHIHRGAAGVAGPVVINSTLAAGEIVVAANGTAKISKTQPTVDPALAQEIIGNPAGFYMNWHTTLNPGGVIRGPLVKM